MPIVRTESMCCKLLFLCCSFSCSSPSGWTVESQTTCARCTRRRRRNRWRRSRSCRMRRLWRQRRRRRDQRHRRPGHRALTLPPRSRRAHHRPRPPPGPCPHRPCRPWACSSTEATARRRHVTCRPSAFRRHRACAVHRRRVCDPRRLAWRADQYLRRRHHPRHPLPRDCRRACFSSDAFQYIVKGDVAAVFNFVFE